ncbi:GATA-type transcription factor [Aspergillus vadensis CBS 113365]|uniref:GATA-type domain-containing protein n=1 Tax=Aspergillus vadensis (strain CBS 113365 / IMI 142717 / IBT 24658) TaxID=1448311 RepID=A0A319AUM1_ASPVC|nr:hypothetical protein BO88DRAFT_475178 [Aspergillus vadensis CBS 113365]PYH63949.1 hypothetical protein BO88DRAFT_475178 [Aspergillus vadensis CBS 113365]
MTDQSFGFYKLWEHLPIVGILCKDRPSCALKHPAISTAPTSSPTSLLSPTMYSNQSLPLSYSALTGSDHLQSGGISSPASRRILKKDKRQRQHQRQTLPSIHETLENDNDLSYPAPTLGLSDPLNFFSSISTGPLMQEFGYQVTRSKSASINTQHARNASLQSHNFGKAPTQSTKTGITSISGCQVDSVYEYSVPSTPPTGSLALSNDYSAFSQPFSFQSYLQINRPDYPSASYDARPYAGALWKPGMDNIKTNLAARPTVVGQPQSDSIECHLDINEVETFLHEITAISTRVLDFSRHYITRTHQDQHPGPVLGHLPTICEIEKVFNLQCCNQDTLLRLQRALLKKHAFTEQMARKNAFKTGGAYDDIHMAIYQERYKGSRGFASADLREQRDAATTSHCHGCGRTKTPEWCRGPDGARTLCNACGLHYAKLTRKVAVNKASLCFNPQT